MTIRILSDSGCDLPKDIIEKYDIEILPIILINNDIEYFDKVNIESEKVYDDMRNGEVYKTAQIPPSIYNDVFKRYADKGESVIYICFSSGLSGTYQTSLIAKQLIIDEYPDFDLDIIDSKSATSGFGTMVLQAGKMAKEGKTKEEILKMLEFYIEHIEHIFTVDNIEYLFRGGRITRTKAFVGGLLNIKPVLNVEDGKLSSLEQVRGKNKVMKVMLKIMEERSINGDLKNQTIGICHGDDIESALKLRNRMMEDYGVDNFLINPIGGAIGAHTGPGTLGITFLNKSYE